MTQGYTHIVDYAGLFPPASCGMDEAVRRYADYRAGDDRWMLGRFIVPAGRLCELADEMARHGLPATSSWPLSVVCGADLPGAMEQIAAFAARHRARAQVESIEARVATVEDVRLAAAILPATLERYLEVPHATDYRIRLEAIQAVGMSAKLRTGGVLPEHFPTTTQVRRFLEDAVAVGVSFKATAGLHHPFGGSHPLTYEPGSARHRMFGFVNILLATALLRSGAPGEEIEALLEDDDPAAFGHDDFGWSWRDHRVATADLLAARADGFRAFGSCSFREPVDELALEGRPA